MNRTIATAWLGIFVCVLPGASVATGDCGSIPFKAGVKIFEPNQRALIAWSGTEEILILSTDLRASEPTKVLEVIPLPNKPTVRAGSVKVFAEAVKLINRKLPRVLAKSAGGTFGSDDAEDGMVSLPPAGEVVLHKMVGATDVSVTHVLRPDGFVDWVHKHLKALDVQAPEVPEPLKKVVGEYLDDGCTWFVFNVVSLGRNTQTKQAIEYRFASDRIYYPLRITRTETGRTEVRLLVLTRKLLDRYTFTGLSRAQLDLAHEPVELTGRELLRLHSRSHRLLGRPKTCKLRIWEIRGELSGFTDDLLAGRAPEFRLKRDQTGDVYGPFPLAVGERFQIGAETFTVEVGDPHAIAAAGRFRLRHFRMDRSLGPFRFDNGARVVLGDRAFTLLRTRRPIGPKPTK